MVGMELAALVIAARQHLALGRPRPCGAAGGNDTSYSGLGRDGDPS